jgi:hypothetical protein
MYSGRIKKDNISKACGQNMSRNPKRTIDVRERERSCGLWGGPKKWWGCFLMNADLIIL